MEFNDDKLVKNAQKGDMTAFETLVNKYDKQVLNIAYSYRNNPEDAKDIFQEVFIRVYKGLKNFQFRSEFSTWLYRITTNVCITYKNQKAKYSYASLDQEISSDSDIDLTRADLIENSEHGTDMKVIGENISDYINKAVDNLPPQQKLAFTLKYFQGYKIREIAIMMNCTEGTIKKYLFTATNKMRNQLKNILEA